jgi:hypothetical protein
LYRKYYRGPNPLGQENFRKELARTLIQCHVNPKPQRGRRTSQDLPARLTERHFPSHIPAKPGAKCTRPRRKCIVCNSNRGKRRQPGESIPRTETSYWCKDCQKPLCVVCCFERYHTLIHYKINNGESESDSE